MLFRSYMSTVDGPRFDSGSFPIDLQQTRCQSQKINSTSLSQKNFEVSPSTYALTLGFDDLRGGTNTQVSSSKLKLFNPAVTETGKELALSRFYVQYDGKQVPSPDADPTFNSTTDRTTQRYLESQLYTGSYFNEGGSETIQEYHKRGSYYYFAFPRDAASRATRVVLNQEFTSLTDSDITNLRVLLFDHSRSVARITIDHGVIGVDVVDA